MRHWPLISKTLARLALGLACLVAGCAAPRPVGLALYASLPLNGEAAPRAESVLAGFRLAVAQRGAAACAGRYALRLVELDNATDGVWDATLEAAAANKAATDPAAIGYLGSFEPGPLLVSLPILNQAGPLLVVAPMNTYPAFTFRARRGGEPTEYYPNGRRNLERLGPTDFQAGQAAAQWAVQAGATTVFILFDQYDPTLQGLNVARGFEADAIRLGLQVTGSLGVNRFALEFDSVMEQVARQGGAWPSLLFYAGPPAGHLPLLFAAKRAWLGDAEAVPMLIAPGFAAAEFAAAAGLQAEGAYLVTARLPQAEWPSAGRDFAGLFAEAAGHEPDIEALYGYGAGFHMLEALEAACTGGRQATRRAVLQQALSRPPVPVQMEGELPPVPALPAPEKFAVYRITGGALDFRETIRAGE